MEPRWSSGLPMEITDLRIDAQRERRFRALVRKALGSSDEVADILSTTDGLLVTLKSQEQFLVMVVNRTGRP